MPVTPSEIVRALVFHAHPDHLPAEVEAIFPKYRLMVNRAIRAGLEADATSRASLSGLIYAELSAEHKGLSAYVVQAIEDAVAILHAHRKRKRRGRVGRKPYVRRPYLKGARSSFHFDAATGNLRISVGNGSWVMFHLPTSDWHRAQLRDAAARLVQVTIKPGKVVLVLAKEAPPVFEPESIVALDTNEESLEGVLAARGGARLVKVPLGGIRAVQARHFERRRRLARKKAHDGRLKRRLLGREGKRESDRVRSRLHRISKGLVETARARKAAIVLEDLTGIRKFFSPRLNRRLSAWPHRELHRQVAYKAQAAGVPVVLVDPYLTSKKCAMCGWTPKRSNARKSARRVDAMFVCGRPDCTWKVNRQFNAGVNILRTALAARPGLGGVRFHLDALSHDAMNLLYVPAPRAARGERMERESQTSATAVTMATPSTVSGQ